MIKRFLFKKLAYKFSKINSSINLKPKELIISPQNKCLCLCPHADDESIGMGGLLSLYPDNFEVILLTDGRKGIKDLSVEEVIKTRENEFECAMNTANIKKYSFYKIEDKKLADNFELFKKIDLSSYDYIFLPNIIDQHPDHKAVSLLLNQKLTDSTKVKNTLQICFYEVWSSLGFVNAFVDISNVVDFKKNMIRCYQSQTSQKDYEYHALGLNQYRGMLKDNKYTEAFCIMSVKEFQKMCSLY